MSDPDTFAATSHKRSNVETRFSITKGKFGDSGLSKSEIGQVNRVLCKVLAHNVVAVGPAAIGFGIASAFGGIPLTVPTDRRSRE